MNFIAIEGCSGVGKSTLMKALQHNLTWPTYRPFRSNPDEHTPGELEPGLARLSLPVNTFMEDLYVADVLQTTKAHVILDRSMPSALAYDALGKGLFIGNAKRIVAMAAWARRVKTGEGLLVHLEASSTECVKRSKRFSEEHITGEARYIAEYVELARELGVKTLSVDTTSGPRLATLVGSVLRAL